MSERAAIAITTESVQKEFALSLGKVRGFLMEERAFRTLGTLAKLKEATGQPSGSSLGLIIIG